MQLSQQLPGYELSSLLGKGGMAKVYLGKQLSLDRPVAIKVLNDKLLENPIVQQQFQQESLMVASLNHPNIIQVIDQGQSEEGRPYFVMQYVKGISLSSIISRDDVNLTRKIDIVVQICQALSYAHRNGVVHRDIKPGNVLVDYEGIVRVVDFGIAGYYKDVDVQDKPKAIFGTPAYMAPEQNRIDGDVTHLSDIYSLGVLMFELFLGCKPKDFLKRPPTFPAVLLELMQSCIEKEQSKRPQSADEVRQQLLLVLKGKHLKATQWEKEKQEGPIPDNYGLLDVLKENKYGATYLVTEPKRQQLLVVKKQYIAYSGDVLKVSELLARQQHPHVAMLHGTAKNDKLFIAVMEYVEGGSLQDRLTQAFGLDRWLLLAIQVCKGIEFAHDKKVIHGNLRPSNILVASPMQIKVTDFGYKDHSIGTGDDWYQPKDEKPGVSSDIYSVGAVLFHLLTGEVVKPNKMDIDNKEALEVLPEPLQKVLLKMLKASPKNRYKKIKEARLELEAFNNSEDTIVFQHKEPEQLITKKSNRALWGKILLVVVSALVVAQLVLLFGVDIFELF